MFISLLRTNLEKNDINICKCFSIKTRKRLRNTFFDKSALTYTVQPVQASHFHQKKSKFTRRHKTFSTGGVSMQVM